MESMLDPYRCWQVSKLNLHIPGEGELPPIFVTFEENEEVMRTLEIATESAKNKMQK